MSNLLLCDPVLQWFEPHQLIKLKHINKECCSFMSNYIASKKSFHVKEDTHRTWMTRQRLYQEFPHIESLTFECSHFNKLTSYLRPTLRSVHLVFPLWFYEDKVSQTTLSLLNDGALVEALHDLKTYLEMTPDCQLHQLSISLSPKVDIMFTYYNAIFCGYDSHGPMYEDTDITKESTDIPPWEFFEVLNQPQKALLEEVLRKVALKPNWNHILLPYHFPGAKMIPNAVHTNVYEYDEHIQEFLSEYLWYLRDLKN